MQQGRIECAWVAVSEIAEAPFYLAKTEIISVPIDWDKPYGKIDYKFQKKR